MATVLLFLRRVGDQLHPQGKAVRTLTVCVPCQSQCKSVQQHAEDKRTACKKNRGTDLPSTPTQTTVLYYFFTHMLTKKVLFLIEKNFFFF